MTPTATFVCLRRAARLAALALVLLILASGLPPRPAAADASSFGWIYLRGGQVPAPDEPLVEVLAVGDVMTGRGLAGTPNLFGAVGEVLRAADLTIGNLEGAISDEPVPADSVWLHLPLSTPAMLQRAGFDLVGLANNHVLDAGWSGLAETRRRLQAEGLEPVESQAAVVRQVNGLRIAFLAWNDLGTPDHDVLLATVRQARAVADDVVVLVHWGREYQRHPALPQRELATALTEAGADVVVGSHPHVAQDVQIVQPGAARDRTRLIAYSLGNFAFDQGWGDTGQGLAVRMWFDAAGVRAAQALPLWTAPRPRWMSADSAAVLLDRVVPPERLGFVCVAEGCEAAEVPQGLRSGIFTSGKIDLTGDGVPETVRREGTGLGILEAGRPVWRSPPGWQVRDVALGDPNGDGRYEAVLAVDSAGGASQPFVVGYRGGRYHDLWGGSPVSDPLLEVELADLDGDGLQELAAIETAADGSARYVTVWRWHGWGFSLVWRSPPGEYRDLVVLPAEDGQPARLSVGRR